MKASLILLALERGVLPSAMGYQMPAAELHVGFGAKEGNHRLRDVPPLDTAELPKRRTLPQCQIANETGHCLPSYMVIGVQKCGTSSLWEYMRQHPQILSAHSKEIFFLNGNLATYHCSPPDEKPGPNDFEKYLKQFPKLDEGTNQTMGEFTATYLQCWCCPLAAKRLMPKARIIVQLRDPIERAKSRWQEQHDRFRLIPTYDSFDEYIEKELPPLEACLEQAADDLEKQVNCAAESNILGMSLYDASIKWWLKAYDREDFLVTYLEQLDSDPASVLQAVEAHLGVDTFDYGDELQKVYNTAGNYGWEKVASLKQTASVLSVQEETLRKFYQPYMAELGRMADEGIIAKLPMSWMSWFEQ